MEKRLQIIDIITKNPKITIDEIKSILGGTFTDKETSTIYSLKYHTLRRIKKINKVPKHSPKSLDTIIRVNNNSNTIGLYNVLGTLNSKDISSRGIEMISNVSNLSVIELAGNEPSWELRQYMGDPFKK
jgi:hypothetical protein